MMSANEDQPAKESPALLDIDGFKYLMGGSGKVPKRKTAWASMNRIQKAGAISCFCLAPGWIGHSRFVVFFGLVSWTCLFLGYVAGSLWKVRHALHFWWSLAAASLAHVAVLPVYAYLIRMLNSAPYSSGRGIIYVLGALVSAEVLAFLFILKRIGLWLHRRAARNDLGG